MHLLKYFDNQLTQPYPIPYIAESYNLEWKKLVKYYTKITCFCRTVTFLVQT